MNLIKGDVYYFIQDDDAVIKCKFSYMETATRRAYLPIEKVFYDRDGHYSKYSELATIRWGSCLYHHSQHHKIIEAIFEKIV